MARTSAASRQAAKRGGYAPDETHRSLMSAGLTLFGAQGYADTSVQEIAERAGVTKGAFYHHFDSKEDLLRVIHDEFVDYQLEAMRRVLTEHDDPAEQIAHLMREFMLSVERYQANVAIFYQEQRYLTGERFKAVKEKRDAFDRMFLSVIERGIQLGSFRADLDPRIVEFGLLGMLAYTYQWYRQGGRHTSDEIADVFTQFALDGLRAH